MTTPKTAELTDARIDAIAERLFPPCKLSPDAIDALWLSEFGRPLARAIEREVRSLAPAEAVPTGNLSQQLASARRHGYLEALSGGTARNLVALLNRGVKQLEAWHKEYGRHDPAWLPPAGDVRWMEDVAEAIEGRAPSNAAAALARAAADAQAEGPTDTRETLQVWCDTCEGEGNIDSASHNEACPDCDGKGYNVRRIGRPPDPAAPPVQPTISQGWKLVPAEPTNRMIHEGILAYQGKCEDSYRAMVDAAPAPPVVQPDPQGWKLLKDTTFEERSWPEDEGHENGCYWNSCARCLRQFTGHKRRVVCKSCAATPEQPQGSGSAGHCPEKRKPGKCQLHNLHCGYPACDRKESTQ